MMVVVMVVAMVVLMRLPLQWPLLVAVLVGWWWWWWWWWWVVVVVVVGGGGGGGGCRCRRCSPCGRRRCRRPCGHGCCCALCAWAVVLVFDDQELFGDSAATLCCWCFSGVLNMLIATPSWAHEHNGGAKEFKHPSKKDTTI